MRSELEVISKDKEIILFKIPDNKEIIEKDSNLHELYIADYESISDFINGANTDSVTTSDLIAMELTNNNSIDLVLAMYTKLADTKKVPKDTLIYHIRVINPDGSTQYLINTNIIDTVDTILYTNQEMLQ